METQADTTTFEQETDDEINDILREIFGDDDEQ